MSPAAEQRSLEWMEYCAAEMQKKDVDREQYEIFHKNTRSQIIEWSLIFLTDWFKIEFSDYDDQFFYELELWMLGLDINGKPIGRDRAYVREYVSPRGYTKTTKCQAGILWLMTEGVYSRQYIPKAKAGDESLFYLTQKDELAAEKMSAIFKELEQNQKIRERYGSLIRKGPKDGCWVELKNEFVLDAGGVLGTRRGKHPDRLLIDDPESTDVAESEVQRRKFLDRWHSDFVPMMVPESPTFITGNYVSEDCVLYQIGNEPNTVTTVRAAIEMPDGTPATNIHDPKAVSVMPSFYTKQWLINEEATIGNKFWVERMNDLSRGESTSPIKSHSIQWYNPQYMPLRWWESADILRYTFCDPAVSEAKTACDTAIVTFAATFQYIKEIEEHWYEKHSKYDLSSRFEPFFYCIDARAGHWDPDETLEQLYEVYIDFKFHKAYMEKSVMSVLFKPLYEHRITTRHQIYPLEMQPNDQFGTDKMMRIQNAAPHFSRHRVYLNEMCPFQKEMQIQLCRFKPKPNKEKKDLADACAGVINNLANEATGFLGFEEEEYVPRLNPRTGRVEG
jgi:hypothetical protein